MPQISRVLTVALLVVTGVQLPCSVFGQVSVDAATRYQSMDGFGSSERVFDDPHLFNNFNSATGRALTVMSSAQQDQVLDRLYIDLNLTRVRPASPDTAVGAGIEPVNDDGDCECHRPQQIQLCMEEFRRAC